MGSERSDGARAPGPCRVLVIEDEAPVANALALALAAEGCVVTVATDGEAGRDAFVRERPDLVICDLLLPRLSGFCLIEDMRLARPDVPVVVTSGVYRATALRHDLGHARAFLEKPLGPGAIAQVVALAREAVGAGTSTPAPSAAGTPAKGPVRRSRQPWVPTSVLPLASALALAWRRRSRGLLTHRVGNKRTVFQVDCGLLRFIRTNDPRLRLDRVLLDLGSCEPAAILSARASLEARTSPTRLGHVLVEQGALSRAELRQALEAQLGCVVAASFSAAGGESLYLAETELPPEEISLDIDLRSLVIAASANAADPDATLLGHLPDGSCAVALAPAATDEGLALPPTVRRLLRAVGPGTRVSDLVAVADLAGLAAHALVHALLATGVLTIPSGPGGWRPAAPVARGPASPLRPDALPPLAFLDLAQREATGVLAVTVRGRSFRASWRGGLVAGASSDDGRERLGERLVASGLLGIDELEAALAEHAASRPQRPLGQVLVDRGALAPGDLLRAVHAQAAAVVREMLAHPRWDDASFVEGCLPHREPTGMGAPARALVLDFLRRCPTDHVDWLVGRLVEAGGEASPGDDLARAFELQAAELDVARSLPRDAGRLVRLLGDAARSDAVLLRTLCLALLHAAGSGVRPRSPVSGNGG